MDLVLHFDGACEPNPGGVATWGFVVRQAAGELVYPGGGVVETRERTTNNLAEYVALGKGLGRLLEMGFKDEPGKLLVRGDSKLVIEQLNGNWQCNAPLLVKCRDRCRQLLADLGWEWRAEWVPRDQNAEADALSVAAYERHTGKPFPHRQRKAKR